MPIKKDLTEEERAAMLERMAAMREKALEKKKEMGQVTKAAKEVKQALFQKRKEEVEEMKRMLNPPTEPKPESLGKSEFTPTGLLNQQQNQLPTLTGLLNHESLQGFTQQEMVNDLINQVNTPTNHNLIVNEQSKHGSIPTKLGLTKYEPSKQGSTTTKPDLIGNEPSKQFDEEALRKQIKAEMKQKYKSKYKPPAFPYFPYYPYPQYQPMAQPPQPQAPPQPEALPKQAVKEVIRDKVNDEVYKMVYSQLFPNL